MEEFKRKHKKDISQNKRVMRRLRTRHERAKRTLSLQHPGQPGDRPCSRASTFYTSITRARFEELCSDLFRSTLGAGEGSTRRQVGQGPEIHDLVLWGLHPHPQGAEAAADFQRRGRALTKSINPTSGIRGGGAGAILDGGQVGERRTCCWTWLPCRWTETAGGVMTALIAATPPSPRSRRRLHSLDNQPGVLIQVYEGERAMTLDNNLLGRFELSGIPPAPRGCPRIEVTFDIDANGILNVTATDKSTGKANKITITNDKGRLSKEEIERMVQEAEKYKAEDEVQRERVCQERAGSSHAST